MQPSFQYKFSVVARTIARYILFDTAFSSKLFFLKCPFNASVNKMSLVKIKIVVARTRYVLFDTAYAS